MGLAIDGIKAVRNNYIGTVIRVGAQFIAQIFIMRELGPEPVGAFGYALLSYGLLALVIDQGFGWSLIQGNFEDKKEISTVFSRVMMVSLICMCSIYYISFWVQDYLHNKLVGEVFRFSAPSYLLIGMYIISQAKLRADLRFKEIQTAITGAYVFAYLFVGVLMAWGGYGIWALLSAWYVQGILQFIIMYYYSPHSLKLSNPFYPTQSGPLGRNVAGINILNWAVDGSCGVFVGGYGASALGNFNAASMLTRTPSLQLVQTLQTVLFSTASAMGSDSRLIKKLYLGALSAIAYIVVPAYGYGITHAEFVVKIVFGDKWVDSGGIFATLSFGMIALAISTLSGSILTATKGEKEVLYSQIICLFVLLFGLYATKKRSFVYVGVCISIAYWIRLILQAITIASKGNIKWKEFLHTLRGPFYAAAIILIPVPNQINVNSWCLIYELLMLLLKGMVVIFLITKKPNIFLCPQLVEVLNRFNLGRKFIGLCKWV